MLEKVDLTRKYPKEAYRQARPMLRQRLYDLQKACWDHGIPSIIVFEGWDAAGKGSAIATLTARLDPRGFKLHPVQAPRTYEVNHPWLWRFWLKTPNKGEMAIFDRSWYGRVLVERVEGLTPEAEWRKAYRDIVDFERMLADDGTVIMKFFLHISKKEQKKRFKRLETDPLEAWHVQPEDWDHHKKYDFYLLAYEEMLERTDTEWGPWTIVEATNRWWARKKIFDTIIAQLEDALGDKAPPVRPMKPKPEDAAEPVEAAPVEEAPAEEVPVAEAGAAEEEG
jgi:polyphosphate kinase 2 (PPK2 family)